MRVKLTIEDEAFYIEVNECGEPQIRRTDQPLVTRDDQAVMYLGGEHGTAKYPLVVKVEAA